MDDQFDGIRLYNNPAPGWWHAIFICTIIWAAAYIFTAEFSPMYAKPVQAHAAAVARSTELLFGDLGELVPDERTLLTVMEIDDGRWREFAASKFAGKCASCHGALGQGMVGPNLTDDFWKNVKSVTDIYDTITDGAAAGVMPAQKNIMSDMERVLVAAYVASLRGSNPPGGLGPDGEEIEPWPEYQMEESEKDESGG